MKLYYRYPHFPSKDILYWAAFMSVRVLVACKIAWSRGRYSKSQRIHQNMTVGAVWAHSRVQNSTIACVMTISALTITCKMAPSRARWICQDLHAYWNFGRVRDVSITCVILQNP